MSIEANTFERITIVNANEKTKAVAEAFGEYLLKTWGILSLEMKVDGKEYRSDVDTVAEDEELAAVCARLGEAKSVTASVRSENEGGLNWRRGSCFLSLLTDEKDVKGYVTYKSTDYYDTDETVDLYCFGENGEEKPEYDQTADAIADIREWFCYTPTIRFECDDSFEDAVRDAVNAALFRLPVGSGGIDADAIEEDDCEICLEGSVRFGTENIPMIAAYLQQAVDALQNVPDASAEIFVNALPDGPDDYDFAAVRIRLEDKRVKVEYCRF